MCCNYFVNNNKLKSLISFDVNFHFDPSRKSPLVIAVALRIIFFPTSFKPKVKVINNHNAADVAVMFTKSISFPRRGEIESGWVVEDAGKK